MSIADALRDRPARRALPGPGEAAVDVNAVVRRVAEQSASALADAWVRIAVLEAQINAARAANKPST